MMVWWYGMVWWYDGTKIPSYCTRYTSLCLVQVLMKIWYDDEGIKWYDALRDNKTHMTKINTNLQPF